MSEAFVALLKCLACKKCKNLHMQPVIIVPGASFLVEIVIVKDCCKQSTKNNITFCLDTMRNCHTICKLSLPFGGGK